jgi:hypothetical protein
VEACIRQLEAQRIFPIHATPHGIGGLAIRESFDILHHHHEGQTPRRDLDGMPPVRIEIGKEVLLVERAKLRPQVHIQIAFGKGSLDHGRRGLGNWWERMRTPGHVSPPCRTTTAGLSAIEGEYTPWSWSLRINQQSQDLRYTNGHLGGSDPVCTNSNSTHCCVEKDLRACRRRV